MAMDIADWLRRLGLEQYASAFAANDIDGEILPELTADDLIGLGVTSIGHRRRLLAAIAARRNDAAQADTEHVSAVVRDDAERRQLTVMFCDLVGSTALSARLDPEDLREVIARLSPRRRRGRRRVRRLCRQVHGRWCLVYFGYPRAHEDDAERAVRAGLGVIDAVGRLDVKSVSCKRASGSPPGWWSSAI